MARTAGGDRAHAAGSACRRARSPRRRCRSSPRRWADAGFDPRRIDLARRPLAAPAYTVDDIRQSIDAHPPWGDYQGITPADALREPMRVFMSGGTTGKSRPTFYTQWDREVGALLTARALYMQGIRPGDVVLNSWAYGTHNGAFSFDEALHRWLNCVVLTTGTGNVTSSERQVELAIQYGAAAILTTGDYLLRLADVARGDGLRPRHRLQDHARSPTSATASSLESTFGVECFNSYGFHEVQWVSVECPAHDGLHIFEDAFVVQIVDPETGEPLPDGELGFDLHHRALQDREPAVPVQHHGPVVPVPARAVRVRQLAAEDGAVRRTRRQHGEAPGRQRVARGGRRRSRSTVAGVGARLVRARGARRRTATSSSSRSSNDGDAAQRRGARERDRDAAQGPARRAASPPRSSRPARSTRGPGVGRSPKLKRFRDDR